MLAWLTPARRRGLLALAALYVGVRRPLREMAPVVDLGSAAGVVAAAGIVLALFALLYGCYLGGRHFGALPAVVRRHPQLTLHAAFWTLLVIGWALGGTLAGMVVGGLVLCLPVLLWRLGYLAMSAQRGRVAGTRFADHLAYLYPAWGGGNTPYGKGADTLARHEARTDDALARAQLAGVKLLVLAACWSVVLDLFDGLVWAEPGAPLAGWGLGLPRLEALLAGTTTAGWPGRWASLYAELVHDVLRLAARGHVIVGILRLAGFYVFRNTYRPLAAPTLVEFWNRYYYYFKELLVEFFFLPTYVRWFRRHPRLRMLAATVAAAGVGNVYYHLLHHDHLLLVGALGGIGPWLAGRGFYAALLAAGIFVSMQREQRRRGRASAAGGPLGRLRAIAGVWTFYGVLQIWSTRGSFSFATRALFALSLLTGR